MGRDKKNLVGSVIKSYMNIDVPGCCHAAQYTAELPKEEFIFSGDTGTYERTAAIASTTIVSPSNRFSISTGPIGLGVSEEPQVDLSNNSFKFRCDG